MGVSKNSDTPKSSILIGVSIINHPFWGTPIFGNIHMVPYVQLFWCSIPFQNAPLFTYGKSLPKFTTLPKIGSHSATGLTNAEKKNKTEAEKNPKLNLHPLPLPIVGFLWDSNDLIHGPNRQNCT